MRETARKASLWLGAALMVIGAALYHLRAGFSFEEVVPGLYRCNQPFLGVSLSPVLIRIEQSKGLLFKTYTSRWILVDASSHNSALQGRYATKLVRAVQHKLAEPTKGKRKEKGRLDLIILSHAHTDHTGALPLLLSLYPEAKVVTHVEEMQYVFGENPPSHFEGPGLLNKMLRAAQGDQVGIPKDHGIHVHGNSGDLADALHGSAAAQESVKWMPHGVIRFIHVPGHTPGHMSLLHLPSKTLLAADAVIPTPTLRGLFGLSQADSGRGGLRTLPSWLNSHPEIVKLQAKRLLQQEDYERVLPYHGGIYTRQQALEAVHGWPSEPLQPYCHGTAAAGEVAGGGSGQCAAAQQDVEGGAAGLDGLDTGVETGTRDEEVEVGEKSEL